MRKHRTARSASVESRLAGDTKVDLVEDATPRPTGPRLGELMVAAQYVTQEDVDAALAKASEEGTSRPLGGILIEQGLLSEVNLARALADQHKLPMVDLRSVTPDPQAVNLIDEVTARTLVILPLAIDGDTVRIAVADPSPGMLSRVRNVVGRRVVAEVAPSHDILLSISGSYRKLTGLDTKLQEFEARDSQRRDQVRVEAVSVNEDAPVVQVVQKVISQGLRDRASDIHIEPFEDRVRVRFRVDGALHDVLDLPGSIGPAVVSRVKILGGMNIVERRRPQDGQISTTIDDRDVDIRVATTAVVGGEKVVMRLLDKSRPLYELSQLGMPAEAGARFSELLRSPFGMVICAGPTGSGKTTTLYGALSEINTPERNIMTIEDPVEYTFPSINQIQINEQAGITFSGGLRSILRLDPDVILVGEVRDVDTARIAVQAALTGHFVLSSLHATDAVSALHRLLDMGIEGFLIASSITAIVAQRLVRRICTYCTEPYEPSVQELRFLETFDGTTPPGGYVRGAGCNFCMQTGYLERIGVYELMTVTDTLREAILAHASIDELRTIAAKEGLRTLTEEALQLVQAGTTTLSEVMRSIYVSR
jgi:type IV pilus assembly protein PilB